ncbi:MAG: enoyl-CoA hydratase/isomerase family protein [Chloroflexi bacterium]|nr:enoyl-CoA hydratase/isomerase family protein [Chloroflexota bacterium]
MGRYVSWMLDDAIATITIDNPPLNILSPPVEEELAACVDAVAADDRARVAILTAVGDRAFMAGMDIREFPRLVAPDAAEAMYAFRNRIFNTFDFMPKATIVAVNGLCYGGGWELALCGDLVVASENATFAMAGVKVGTFHGCGATIRLARMVGEMKAKELMYLGNPIGAHEAAALGLVSRVVALGQALAAAHELAAEIAGRPYGIVRAIKQAIERSYAAPFEEALADETELLCRGFRAPDAREGYEAFFAKRAPRFSHTTFS